MMTDEMQSGFIRVTNRAAFIATFLVGYDLNGGQFFPQSPYFPVLQSYTIKIPAGATNIGFLTFRYDELGSGDILISRYNFNTPPKQCYNIYGTIWNPSCKRIPCDGDDGGNGGDPDIPDPPCCHPCCCCCHCCSSCPKC